MPAPLTCCPWTSRSSSPAPAARFRARGAGCRRCSSAAAASACCSTAAKARSASCCARSGSRTSTRCSSRTSTPTTGWGCRACSSPSRCATAQQPLTVYGPRGLAELMGAMRIVYGRLPYELDDRGARARCRPCAATATRWSRCRCEHSRERLPRLRARRGRAPGRIRPRTPRRRWGSRRARTSGACSAARAVGGVRPEQVMGPPRQGRKIVSRATPRRARRSRWRRTRPTCSCTRRRSPQDEAERARETGHSTARQAAELARDAQRAPAGAHARLEPLRRRRAARGGPRGVRGDGHAARLRHDRGAPSRSAAGAQLVRWSERQGAAERAGGSGGRPAGAGARRRARRRRTARRSPRADTFASQSFNPVPRGQEGSR